MFKIPDVDLDCNENTRNDILNTLYHIPASKINEKGIFPHNVGIYLMDIPVDRITNLSSIDYKRAEEDYGYIKFDILHNTIYDKFSNRDEIFESINKEPDWNKIYNEDYVKTIPHIGNYYQLLNELPKIDSIEKLSMFIAVIRPGKKYLIDDLKKYNNWDIIKDRIWKKEDNGYMYKKSHSIGYALSICLFINSN